MQSPTRDFILGRLPSLSHPLRQLERHLAVLNRKGQATRRSRCQLSITNGACQAARKHAAGMLPLFWHLMRNIPCSATPPTWAWKREWSFSLAKGAARRCSCACCASTWASDTAL